MNSIPFQDFLTKFPFIDDQNSNVFYQKGVDVSNFRMIRNNAHKIKKKTVRNKDLINVCCDCVATNGKKQSTCDADCINRILFIECFGSTPCGEDCGNRNIQQGNNFRFVIYPCGDKGVGLKCLDEIKKDQYVLEFVGEIIDLCQFNARIHKYNENNLKHSYIMALNSKSFIDATLIGGVARFINHSCSPNLASRKWSVGGYTRIGFFALCDISTESELTFDYKFERFGEPIKCLCGSISCKGYMGKESNSTIIKNALLPKKRAKNPLVTPSVVSNLPPTVSTPSSRNPVTFIRYMRQLYDWGKRFKVIKYLKEACVPDFLAELVLNKIGFVLTDWMRLLDPLKCDVIHHKKLIEIVRYLPINKCDDLPYLDVIRILENWMQLSTDRKAKGTEKNALEFGRQCRLLLDKISNMLEFNNNFTDNGINLVSSDVVTNGSFFKTEDNSHPFPDSTSLHSFSTIQHKDLFLSKKKKFKKELTMYVTGCLNPYYSCNDSKAIINNTERFLNIRKNLINILINKELENMKMYSIKGFEFNEETRKSVYNQIIRYVKNLSSSKSN